MVKDPTNVSFTMQSSLNLINDKRLCFFCFFFHAIFDKSKDKCTWEKLTKFLFTSIDIHSLNQGANVFPTPIFPPLHPVN